ncbi:CD276 antigen homolog isoform X2 [Labeo rohita]|uniref:CD276 antigen homolog isoform X2 n=1 Tax=Labeo rohita TaxID=84645 RepID=UPI0021E2EC77|nr:CD276 antigen homolog isoform X2 [Labeo rohita]
MASLIIMVFAVFSFFITAVTPSGDFWTLNCPSSIVAIAGQTTVISCNFKNIQEINIVAVVLKKDMEEDTTFQMYKGETSGNQRFSLKNQKMGPSLQISETMFSDEGKYLYRVVTDRGAKEVQLSISITAKYKDPITSTWPEKVTEGGPVDLYCNATDGYPAGFIHWFDGSGTNWTMNSEMIKTNKDSNSVKSVALSSKLTFKTINFAFAPFTCIVFNSKYVEDGKSTLQIQSARSGEQSDSSGSNTTNIVAGVMVIGSLIVGLLFALLLFRKKKYSYEQGNTAEDDVENGETVQSTEASTIKR